jgi:cytochrome c-type biogenesis protein CcmH/NrfG
MERGDFACAERAARRAIRIDPRHHTGWLLLGDVLWERHFSTASDTKSWRFLGQVLEGKGRAFEALKAYRQVVRLDPENAEGHLGRASALESLGRLQEAREAYEETVRLDPVAPPPAAG